MSKMAAKGKGLALSALRHLRPKVLTHKQYDWDRFLTEKLNYFGLRDKAAYAVVGLNVIGFGLYYLMYTKPNFYRRFAYESEERNRFFKHLTCHFANNNPYIFAATIPLLTVLARRIEILYGTAFLIKLTFMSICMNALSMRTNKVLAAYLPSQIRLPIDQVSQDGKYQMGPHGILATYMGFYLLKFLKGRGPGMWIVAGLALADTMVSQKGYWGGYLAAILAFLAF